MEKIIIVFLVLILIAGLYGSVEESKEWKKFQVDHKCEVVSKEKGSVGVGNSVSPSGGVGIVTISTPNKTGWLCDDGVTYYR